MPNRPVSRRRREHDGNVVSNSMRSIAQITTPRPVEVAVAPKNVSILSSLLLIINFYQKMLNFLILPWNKKNQQGSKSTRLLQLISTEWSIKSLT